jgi:hypothetical protein
MGRPKPGAVVQVGGADARHLGAVVVHGHLDAVGVCGQVQGAGSAAVTQGVGDELRDDQDHGVGILGCDRTYETSEEVPGAVACTDDGGREAGGRHVEAHGVHQVSPVCGSSMSGSPGVSRSPACGPLTRR